LEALVSRQACDNFPAEAQVEASPETAKILQRTLTVIRAKPSTLSSIAERACLSLLQRFEDCR
jgi:hypothetical protein